MNKKKIVIVRQKFYFKTRIYHHIIVRVVCICYDDYIYYCTNIQKYNQKPTGYAWSIPWLKF